LRNREGELRRRKERRRRTAKEICEERGDGEGG
jgi:hypothetical protein